jgi:hypothetical protein
MHNITVICTRHKEVGACNSNELLKIIEECRPEVIFEELAPTAYDACYSYNVWGVTKITTLETDAIKIYREYYDIKHIPVLSAEMNKDLHLMHSKVNNRNLQALVDNLISLEGIYGFPFLNSDECEQQLDEIKKLERSLLNDDELYIKAYQCVDNYENDMLKNIYGYSAQNKYDKALMFIGAAHRKTITQKIKEYNDISSVKLNWTFYNNKT